MLAFAHRIRRLGLTGWATLTVVLFTVVGLARNPAGVALIVMLAIGVGELRHRRRRARRR